MTAPKNFTPKNELASPDTRRPEIKRAGDLVSRWRDLAEQRLEHMIDLYQSGRWQKYYNETDFLRQIREVVAAIEAWKLLVPSQQTDDSLRRATMSVWKDIGGGDTSLAPVWQDAASAQGAAPGIMTHDAMTHDATKRDAMTQGLSPGASHDASLAPSISPRDNAAQTEAPSILPKAGSSSAADVLNNLANAGSRFKL